ncbi:glycosyltransferase family 9 protein [Dyella solisilvae]|uniref:glycosyltransferase family 9 protein n=1 Tax=Dyella solisilvae TaxID=1920168 RepID=UPI0011C03F5E|nr:glycosyltransferase family 9 protein [Dyella solisilvae]
MSSVSSLRYGLSLPTKGIYRILVCRPNHRLGNTLLLTPLIAELERSYKGAEIDVISEGDIAREVFSTHFSIKNVFCLPRRGFKHPVTFLRLLLKIRRTRYDLIIDPCIGSGFSRAVTRFLHGTYKLGFGNRAERSGLTHAIPSQVAMQHMAKRPVDLLRSALGQTAPGQDSYPPLDIRLTSIELAHGRQTVAGLLSSPRQHTSEPVVGIFANATGAKRYPMDWWREFIDTFKTLCPAANIIELIPMHANSMLGAEWPAYYSSAIRRMAAVMAGFDLLITADCGVMHLAVASRVPTVGLFCVTDPGVYEPYGPGNRAWKTQGLSAREAACRVVVDNRELLGLPAREAGGEDQLPLVEAVARN